jgi:hypothetical protein
MLESIIVALRRIVFSIAILVAGAVGHATAAEPSMSAGMGLATCAQFGDIYRENPEFAEQVFFSWATGYMTAWNAAFSSRRSSMIDLSGMTPDQQKGFIRSYCDRNPLKQYMLAVGALLGKLKSMDNLAK